VTLPPVSETENEPDVSWNVHETGGGGGGGVGAGGVGAGGVGAGGVGAGAGGAGAGEGGGGVAAVDSCDNMTLCPATVTAAERGAGLVLGVTMT
jgi:hypothetical protein